MPKRGSDDLFRLIKSMSKTEKSYFKKFAERHVIGEQNNYLKLFDAIERQEVYDEKKILREEKYIKQLPYLKNYLMDAVLKSLQVFYAEHTREHRLRRMMDNAWLLYQKGLFDLALDAVVRIKKEAVDTVTGTSFVDAVRLEERIIGTTGNNVLHEASIEQSIPEEHALLNDLLLYNEITRLYLKAELFGRKIGPRPDQKARAQLQKEIGEPLQELAKKAKTTRCRIRLYTAQAVYHALLGEYETYYQANKKLFLLFRSTPELVRSNPLQYIAILNNYGTASGTTRRFSEAMKAIREIQDLDVSQPEEIRRRFITAATLELNTHKLSGNYKAATVAFERLREKLYELLGKNYIQRYFTLCTYSTLCYIYIGQHQKALRVIADVLADSRIRQSRWLKNSLELLQIICLYERGYEIMPFVKNVRRRLKSRAAAPAEWIVLGYLERTQHLTDPVEKSALAQQTIAELEAVKTDMSYVLLAGYFEIVPWLESQGNPKSFPELIRRRKMKQKYTAS